MTTISTNIYFRDDYYIAWYLQEYDKLPSVLELRNLSLSVQLGMFLDDIGFKNEILAVPEITHSVVHEFDTPDGEPARFQLNPLDYDLTDLYTTCPDETHPMHYFQDVSLSDIESDYIIYKLKQYPILIDFRGIYCRILYQPANWSIVKDIANKLALHTYIEPTEVEEPRAFINLVTIGNNGLTSIQEKLPYAPITSNMLQSCYSVNTPEGIVNGQELMDDLVDKISMYKYDKDKNILVPHRGLYIVHGRPGTGKSKFLSQLVLELASRPEIADKNRQVYYFPPQSIRLIGTPAFAQWLLDRKNSIIIAEDAESVLVQSENRTEATSNILNMTDGFLSELLQIVLITTFNCQLQELDSALLRPGRLKKMAHFERLSNEQSTTALTTIMRDKYGVKDDTEIDDSLSKLLKEEVSTTGYSLAEIYSVLDSYEIKYSPEALANK